MFRKLLDEGRAGDNVGVLLRGIGKDRCRARAGIGETGSDHTAHQVQGGGIYFDERRKAAGTHLFSTDTVPSFTSGLRT